MLIHVGKRGPSQHHMALWIIVNIGSGNGLFLDIAKQLPEPMLN